MVSIIMPIYNAELYLEASITSILNQTCKDFELLLIDDGSTDGSNAICRRFCESDARVVLHSLENKGVSAARNFGIKKAKGEFLGFVDADDFVPEGALAALLERIHKDDSVDLVVGRFEMTVDENNPSEVIFRDSVFFGHEINKVFSGKEFILESLKMPHAYYYGVMWNKLYRSSVISANNLSFNNDVNWAEDMLFNCDFYCVASKIEVIPECVYIYNRRLGSLSSGQGLNDRGTSLKMLEIEQLRMAKIHKMVRSVYSGAVDSELSIYLLGIVNAYLANMARNPVFRSNRERFRFFSDSIDTYHFKDLVSSISANSSNFQAKYINYCINKGHIRSLYIFYGIKRAAKKSFVLTRIFKNAKNKMHVPEK